MPQSSPDPSSPLPSYPSGEQTPTVQDLIRRDIITGTLAPGERVTEQALAERYDVSRVPIREALRGLDSEGFLEFRAHVGSRVAPIPVADADDLFALRETLEAATTRRAAERAAALWSTDESPDDWWRMRRQLAAWLEAGDELAARGDIASVVQINDLIHLAIAELGGSTTLRRLLRQLSWKIEWLYAAAQLPRGTRLWSEHRDIIARIDAGDIDEAVDAMRRHVRASWAGYLARYAPSLVSGDAGIRAEAERLRA